MAAVLAGLCGCQSFGGRDPLPESVAMCRQLSQQGMTALDHGNRQQAEALLGRAVDACGTDVEARRQYAEVLASRRALREAAEQLDAARKLDAENVALEVRAGEIRLAMGDHASARQHAERALHLDTHLASAWALRGRAMRAAGQPQQALADLHRSLGYAPRDPAVLYDVAELYRMRGQPQRALATLQFLADIYPPGEEPQQVLHLLGLAYLAIARYEDAAQCLYAASVRGQPSAEILYSLGEAEYYVGRPGVAEASARQALALDPGHRPSQALIEKIAAARMQPMR